MLNPARLSGLLGAGLLGAGLLGAGLLGAGLLGELALTFAEAEACV